MRAHAEPIAGTLGHVRGTANAAAARGREKLSHDETRPGDGYGNRRSVVQGAVAPVRV